MTNLHQSFNKYFLIGTLAIITLWLALDGNHYWHDIRFLYASSQFTMKEILSGAFNPHQLGGSIDEISASGFYLAKVLHIWLLQTLYKWISPEVRGLNISVWFSVLCIGVTIIISYQFFSAIFENKHQAQLAVCCLLLSPIIPYLAGKLLSEVTSFLLITISIWVFYKAIEVQKAKIWGLLVISGIFLLLACLARLDIIICFLGFLTTLFITTPKKEKRINLLKTGFIIFLIFILGYLLTIYSLKAELITLIRYFRSFTSSEMKPGIMSIFGILTFGGVLYILASVALFSQGKKNFLLLITWFLLSSGFAILTTWNYMVEPRYLIHGLLPLAGLGGLGLDVLWEKIKHIRGREVLIIILLAIVTLINSIIIRLMPYELDRPSIITAVNQIMKLDNEPTILIPWSYTDFHFLYIMFPAISIYNVNLPRQNRRLTLSDKVWLKSFDKWYGKAYISTPYKLEKILSNKSVYYLGWGKLPFVEYAKKIVKFFGFKKVADFIDTIPLKNHLSESWIWHSSDYHLEMVGRCGQYEYYKTTLRNENKCSET